MEGILASTSDARILTSCDWRCANSTPPDNWTSVVFDDSGWPRAYAGEQNNVGAPSSYEMYEPSISSCAFWIWAAYWPDHYYYSAFTEVFCRLSLLD